MSRSATITVLAVGLSAVLAGCSGSISGPREVARIGIVDHFGESEGVISVPSPVTAGEPFTVTVRTYGDGCTSVVGTEVEDTVEGGVLITPIDATVEGPNVACPAVLRRPEHEATVTFETTGERTITVRGRRVASGGVDEVILLTRTVEVVASGGS